MLAARGVSLGLGKINLADLNQLPGDKMRLAQLKKEDKKKPRIRIKKKADAKTVWAACRAVILGCIVIVVGLAMAILGYFDKKLSERAVIVDGVETIYYDKFVRYELKAMQYLGPVMMGIGSFILIIACVVTLESRDKHAQIITEESISHKKKRLLSVTEREVRAAKVEEGIDDSIDEQQDTFQRFSMLNTLAEVHRPKPYGRAPLADIDSIDLHSCSSEVYLEQESAMERDLDNNSRRLEYRSSTASAPVTRNYEARIDIDDC